MRCLIIKTSALGDVVHTYPAVQYLRQCHPNAIIDWVVERPCADLVAAHPAVDNCFRIDTKEWRRHPISRATWRALLDCRRSLRSHTYDLVVDLQGNVKSALIASQVKSPCKVGFAAEYVSERPNLWAMHRHIQPPPGGNVREDYLYLMQMACGGPSVNYSDLPPVTLQVGATERAANESLKQQLSGGGEPCALLFAGSAWANKQLDEETLACFLAKTEQQLGIRWLLAWGSVAEHTVAKRLKSRLQKGAVIDRRPLPQLQHLMSLVDLVVSMDSLPLHLAATAGVPTYSFFGPSSAVKYAPIGALHASFQGSCPYGKTFERRCPILRTCSTGLCMRGLASDTLYDHFMTWYLKKK